MEWHEQIRALNDLHALLADSTKGYKEAAHKAEDPRLRDFLILMSGERTLMEGELAAELRAFKPDNATIDGTLKGEVHRGWIAIRDALGSSDGKNVLEECERGESYLQDRYQAVITRVDLASSAQALLVRQLSVIRSNLNSLKTLQMRLVDEA